MAVWIITVKVNTTNGSHVLCVTRPNDCWTNGNTLSLHSSSKRLRFAPKCQRSSSLTGPSPASLATVNALSLFCTVEGPVWTSRNPVCLELHQCTSFFLCAFSPSVFYVHYLLSVHHLPLFHSVSSFSLLNSHSNSFISMTIMLFSISKAL